MTPFGLTITPATYWGVVGVMGLLVPRRRHGGGSQRSGGRRNAIRNKEVQIPRRWHRRCCRAPQNHRPDQLGSRSALATP
jgi:hypothetical protein